MECKVPGQCWQRLTTLIHYIIRRICQQSKISCGSRLDFANSYGKYWCKDDFPFSFSFNFSITMNILSLLCRHWCNNSWWLLVVWKLEVITRHRELKMRSYTSFTYFNINDYLPCVLQEDFHIKRNWLTVQLSKLSWSCLL